MEPLLCNLLEEGITETDTSLYSEALFGKLTKLYDEITLFNPVYKLVAADGKDLVVKHILDCLAPVPIIKKHIGKSGNFADLGSGAGLPGIVLASVLTDCDFTLVERTGRRSGFLRNTVALTGLSGRVKVEEKNLEEVNSVFDYIAFRAFRHLRDISKHLVRITRKGSVIFAYKSSEDDVKQEISDMERIVPQTFDNELISYKVPFLDAERSLLILKRR